MTEAEICRKYALSKDMATVFNMNLVIVFDNKFRLEKDHAIMLTTESIFEIHGYLLSILDREKHGVWDAINQKTYHSN